VLFVITFLTCNRVLWIKLIPTRAKVEEVGLKVLNYRAGNFGGVMVVVQKVMRA
jgi:hypothetical protein